MTPFASRCALLPLLFGAFFLLTACDSSGSNADDDRRSFQNNFSFTVTDSTGATSTLEGFGYFATGTDSETGIEGFVLYFLDDEDFSQNSASNGLFGIAVRNGGRPGPGQYLVSDDDARIDDGSAFGMVLYENLGSQGGSIYTATGGTFDVTRSETNRIDGTMTLQATAFTFEAGATERTVTIEGAFRAPGVKNFFGTDFLQP